MFRVLSAVFLALSGLDVSASTAKHKIIVGTFGNTAFLYTVEYNAKGSLALVSRSAVSAASSWITLNHDKTKLYGTDWNAQISYDVEDPYNIKVEARIVGGIYGNYYYGDARCGTVLSVHENGTLKEVIQEYVHLPGTGVHRTVTTLSGAFLLSADTKGNLIWTHKIDEATGTLSNVSITPGSSEGSGPRHLAIHKNGDYAYVALEESSEVAQYFVSNNGTLHLVGDTYPLLREEQDPTDYWADEVSLSRENRYLWATNRARNNSRKGYISVFELNPTGEIASQLFLLETSTSGGFANSVAASPFDDSIAVLTDNSTGFVEIWHIKHGVIAHLDIPDGQGCCANAVWLD